jgi:hypothetical protein
MYPRSGTILVAVALAVLPIGCSSRSSTPFDPLTGRDVSDRSGSPRVAAAADLSSSGGFYPLAVGNRWHYSRVFTLDYHGLGADTFRTSTDRVNIGTETRSGRTYFVEEETSTQDSRPGEVFQGWTRYRQDRAGLYYRDVCACEPPVLDGSSVRVPLQTVVSAAAAPRDTWTRLSRRVAAEDEAAFHRAMMDLSARMERMRRAVVHSTEALAETSGRPGGADSGEVTLLPYPLHVGKSWQIRPDFGLTWTVEGVEMLETPAGRFRSYRIRVSVPNEGPEDFVRVWFGRAGQLAYRIHVVVTEGYPGAGWTGDETEFVDQLSISR